MINKMTTKLKKTRSFWKKGSADIFSYISFLPVLLILFSLVVCIVQISCIKEKLEYTTYVACRAAAVSSSKSKAISSACTIAEENLKSYTNIYDPASLSVRLTCFNEKGEKTQKSDAWKKGNYVQCEISIKISTIIPAISGTKKSSIAMAIEIPD